MGIRRLKQFSVPRPRDTKTLAEVTQLTFATSVDSPLKRFENAIPRDAFDEEFQNQLRKNLVRSDPSVIGKRESQYRGVTPKEDTIATLRIISNLAGELRNIPEDRKTQNGFEIFATDQFVLQASNEVDNEKIQVVETFGEPIIFMFGRRPRFYNFSGFLYNGGDDPTTGPFEQSTLWRDNFKLAYELFIRGTKCVKFRARAYLSYDRVMREGFIINSTISQDIRPNMVQFAFTMYITREINLDGRLAMSFNTVDGEERPFFPEEGAPGALKQRISPRPKERRR